MLVQILCTICVIQIVLKIGLPLTSSHFLPLHKLSNTALQTVAYQFDSAIMALLTSPRMAQLLQSITRSNGYSAISRPGLQSLRSPSRTYSTPGSSPFAPGPAPPKLPKSEQELYEKLQSSSRGAFSQPQPAEQSESGADNSDPTIDATTASDLAPKIAVEAQGKGEELHPDVRRGAPPEFEGDTNPKTGEKGGPKNEPLRWGHTGDYSYNGRVTDF